MKITTVLFDLDGTLLPLEQDHFVATYFNYLAKKMAARGYESESFIKSIVAGTKAMAANDGTYTNEEVFWRTFKSFHGEIPKEDTEAFDEFYRVEFQQVQSVCGCNPDAQMCVRELKEMGYKVGVATNPMFPAVATRSRVRWAGLDADDFVCCTTFENYRHCKPNPDYYLEVAEKIGIKPEECLMVGNDVDEDMIAEKVGMKVFLHTDCLLNRHNKDISSYPQGSFKEVIKYLKTL